MKVLAFDTTTDACSAALWVDDRIAAKRFEKLARGHVERLVPMVMEVMDDAATGFSDLDLVAVTRGPGTFTGVRIGLAAARGFAIATGLPVAGFSTLEVLANGVANADRKGRGVIAAMDARRGQIYYQVFDEDLAAMTEPAIAERADLTVPAGVWVVTGSGSDAYAGMTGVVLCDGAKLPDASDLAALAARRFAADGTSLPSQAPTPLYLRAPDADLPGP